MDINPVQPAQDRMNAKRGVSQIIISSTDSPDDKKTKTGQDPIGTTTQTEHQARLEETVEEIVAEDEANKAKAAKEERQTEIAYWQDPEVSKMTGRIPSTVILISVAVENVLAFELALDELGWELRMGIEKHRVTVSSPPRRWPATGGPGIQGGPSSGAEGGPRAEADEYAEEEAIDNAQMDEDMDMNTDKSKNNGKDKDSNEQISL